MQSFILKTISRRTLPTSFEAISSQGENDRGVPNDASAGATAERGVEAEEEEERPALCVLS